MTIKQHDATAILIARCSRFITDCPDMPRQMQGSINGACGRVEAYLHLARKQDTTFFRTVRQSLGMLLDTTERIMKPGFKELTLIEADTVVREWFDKHTASHAKKGH